MKRKAAHDFKSPIKKLKHEAVEVFELTEGITEIAFKNVPKKLISEQARFRIVITNGITKILKEAFHSCIGLESIVIAASVTEIGEDAFNECENLRIVVINDGVKIICREAFAGCTKLESIIIPASVTEINAGAFYDCENLKFAIFKKGINKIGEDAFCCCKKLKIIVIPTNITEIYQDAFNECDLLEKVIINCNNDKEFKSVRALLPENLQPKAVSSHAFKKAAKDQAKVFLCSLSIFSRKNNLKLPRPIRNLIIDAATGYRPSSGDIPDRMDFSKIF